jgi:mannose-6-phosphate isomerase-like protein (cupin superfamily)
MDERLATLRPAFADPSVIRFTLLLSDSEISMKELYGGQRMSQTRRRSFLKILAAAVVAPGAYLRGQNAANNQTGKAVLVPSGKDREGKEHAVGVSHTTYKVLTAETAGAMFVMEQGNAKKGGPARHLHHGQDELFYVIEGEYIVEIGSERFHLKTGDCVLGPREVPHAWAFVGETPGKLLLSYSPAGKMEQFFDDREKLGIKKGAYSSTPEQQEAMRSYGMEWLGPPLKIEE